jgi:hypothetical protein
MATLSSVPPIPEEKVPAASKKRGPKAKAAEPEST